MIRILLLTNLFAFLLLNGPDWKPPYALWESVVISIGIFGLFGPWMLIIALVLNRLVNISFRIR